MKGCRVLAADYSQIELRIIAHLSSDVRSLRAFIEGHHVHSATADNALADVLLRQWVISFPFPFQRVRAPGKSELEDLVHLISQLAGRYLERLDLVEQDAERGWLKLEPADDTDATADTRKEGYAVKWGGPWRELCAAPFPIGLLSARNRGERP